MHPRAWAKHFDEHVTSGMDGLQVSVSVGDTPLTCVVASTHESRVRGLSNVTELPDDGMLFIYDGNHTAAYQSHSMAIDVSIWFFDAKGDLIGHGWNGDGVAAAEAPYRYVLETSADIQLEGRLTIHRLAGMDSDPLH